MNKKTVKMWESLGVSAETHRVWHQFSRWLEKTFGGGLLSNEQSYEMNGQIMKFRHFDTQEMSRRIVGYEAMQKVERYVRRYLPEIIVLRCDDAVSAGSTLLLIPHPTHGITVMYIPQCTSVQNQFFLYEHHCKELIKGLTQMQSVYKEKYVT